MTEPSIRMRKAAPTDARQVRSRKALHEALLALLEEKPFDQLTIREITARAGTGYATFFRHYETREALLHDVAGEEIAGLLAMTVPMLDDANSYDSILALCTYVATHERLWSALLAGGAAAIVRDEFIAQARGLLDGGPRQRLDWLPPDLGVVHGTGAVVDILAWWLSHPGELTALQVTEVLHRLVIAPLMGERLVASGTPQRSA